MKKTINENKMIFVEAVVSVLLFCVVLFLSKQFEITIESPWFFVMLFSFLPIALIPQWIYRRRHPLDEFSRKIDWKFMTITMIPGLLATIYACISAVEWIASRLN